MPPHRAGCSRTCPSRARPSAARPAGWDLVRRLPDPEDRRSVVVELTDHGRETMEKTVGAQAQKEALMAAALSPREQKQLNGLLRKVMLELERREH